MSGGLRSASALPGALDCIIVGAGPAGLAAATRLAASGVRCLVLDENPGPGGQIYRGILQASPQDLGRLGSGYAQGAPLVDAFLRSGTPFAHCATVWSVAAEAPHGFRVGVSLGGEARLLQASQVVICTGAMERPFPIPGWTLPGVMGAGAAQIALKSAGLVPSGRVALAGTGPLLLLLAAQFLAAGVQIAALLDTTATGSWRTALPHAWPFLRSGLLGKGLSLLAETRRIPVRRGVTGLEALGRERLEGVRWQCGPRAGVLPADLLLLHQGVVPSTNLAGAAGCGLAWDEDQVCFRPILDSWFESTVPGLAVAGDGGGIQGADAAEWQGRLAALGCLHRLGRLGAAERDHEALALRLRLARLAGARRFLDALYRPADAFRVPGEDGTIVCRCEEVSAGAVRDAARLGVPGPNQLKTFLRCGMGPCQGRFCGLTVSEIIAREQGRRVDEVGPLRLRPPVKPLRLKELASLPADEAAHVAVVGEAPESGAAAPTPPGA